MPRCEMIVTGTLRAECSCGMWKFEGIMSEARLAMKQMHAEHKAFCSETPRSKRKKKGM